ncbi:MAG TPA: TolC family protein [Vicinamibacterales bacterium]|nr:TolC family protein [Vicinamibacterales bacterium]
MRRSFFVALLVTAAAGTSSAQTSEPATLRLTVDEAVKMALDHNIDLSVDRLDPQISDTRVAAAAGAFRPTVNTSINSNNQLQPPSSFLIPTATRTDVITETAGVSQRLSRFGTSYGVSWTAAHTNSNSFLNSYNPLLTSGLGVTVSQPLVRDLFIDNPRQQFAASQINRDIADARLRESLVHTTADVKAAYWNLVSARATVDARRSVLDLAQELARVNKAKVDVGTVPPLDLVSAQAEVAADQEQLIIAETAVKQSEDRLRLLILDTTTRENWNVRIEAVDSPPVATPTLDVDAAITRALAERADLARSRKDIENAAINAKLADNQKLPDVRLNASYQANGLGGTQVLRNLANGFPGTIVGPGDVTAFGSVVGQLFTHDYPTWAVGVSVSYPIGESVDQANAARTKLERQQAAQREKSAEAKAIQQIRDAAWKVEMNGKRIETTRAAHELAEQRLDAERKRLDVGMSTSFLVIQAQRDLAQAKNNELGAVLAYDLALVDFDALQQAGPANQGGQSSQGSQTSQGAPGGQPASAAAGAPASAQRTGASGIPGGQQ